MAYSQAIVLAGGVAHVPILITVLKFLDGKTLKLHKSREAVLAQKKAASAEKAAAAKLQAEQAAAAAAKKSAAVESKEKVEEKAEE